LPETFLKRRLRDPYFYLADFDFETEMMVFAEAHPLHFARSLRVTAADFPPRALRWLPFGRVYKEIDWTPQRPSINYLFHLPFSGSTLLTRYLERGTFMVRDPVSLHALYLKDGHSTPFPRSIRRLRRATLSLLNRPLRNRPTVVRTGGYHPEISAPLVASPTSRAALFLYLAPEEYLAQVLKSAERRQHARILAGRRRAYVARKCGARMSKLSDGDVAALSWAFTIEKILDLAAQPGAVRTLDCARLLEDRQRTLAAVCALFGIDADGLGPAHIREVEHRHAKSGKTFGAGERAAAIRQAVASSETEIASGLDLLHGIDPGSRLQTALRRLAV
jgi:hypothetical protein